LSPGAAWRGIAPRCANSPTQRGLGDPFALPFDEEADLYAALGLPTIPPELREAGGARVAAALAGRLPRPDRAGRPARRPPLAQHLERRRRDDSRRWPRRRSRAATPISVSATTTHGLTVANGLDETRLRAQWIEIDRLKCRTRAVPPPQVGGGRDSAGWRARSARQRPGRARPGDCFAPLRTTRRPRDGDGRLLRRSAIPRWTSSPTLRADRRRAGRGRL
jgi:hypothetical protein